MKMIEPTEMIYSVIRLFYPLAGGEIDGYQYVIINHGYHPCAYVNIPDKHPLRGNRTMIERSIQCHGGISFMENFRGANARIKNQELYKLFGDTFVIGWDYTHYGDFLPGLALSINGKMWRTEEIMAEVKNVIQQLKDMENSA